MTQIWENFVFLPKNGEKGHFSQKFTMFSAIKCEKMKISKIAAVNLLILSQSSFLQIFESIWAFLVKFYRKCRFFRFFPKNRNFFKFFAPSAQKKCFFFKFFFGGKFCCIEIRYTRFQSNPTRNSNFIDIQSCHWALKWDNFPLYSNIKGQNLLFYWNFHKIFKN